MGMLPSSSLPPCRTVFCMAWRIQVVLLFLLWGGGPGRFIIVTLTHPGAWLVGTSYEFGNPGATNPPLPAPPLPIIWHGDGVDKDGGSGDDYNMSIKMGDRLSGGGIYIYIIHIDRDLGWGQGNLRDEYILLHTIHSRVLFYSKSM